MTKMMLCRINGENHCPIEEPLGLLAIAAYFGKKSPDVQIDILDTCLDAKQPEDIAKELFCKKYDFFCASLITPSAPNAYGVARVIRKLRRNGHPIIVFGGPHTTALPEECLMHGADICVMGEGEETLLNLVAWYEDGAQQEKLKEIKGIVFRDEQGNVWKSNKQNRIDFADIYPVPYNAVSKYRYQTDAHITGKGMARPVMFSRGCENNCSFCCSAIMWKRTVQRTTPRKAVEELEYSVKDGYKYFHIYDDDLLASPEWVKSFAQEILSRNLEVQYTCLSSCKSFLRVDEDTLNLLKTSGLSLVEIGVESLMPEVLSELKKNQTVSEIVDVFSRACKSAISIYPLLIIMAPGETLCGHLKQESILRNIIDHKSSLSESLNGNIGIFLRHAGFYTPYPGTNAWRSKELQGIIIDDNWSNWTTAKMCFVPNTLLFERPINLKKGVQSNLMDEVIAQVMKFPLGDVSISVPEAIDFIRWLSIGDNTILDISKLVCKRFNDIEFKRALTFTVISVLAGGIIGEYFIPNGNS